MFWWWGNIMMAMWAGVTIVAGIRYADGTAVNGPIALLGEIFDSLFGLDTCRKIPSSNQRPSDFKQPCYFCAQPTHYPHAGEQEFVINREVPQNVAACTGVSGVGGINGNKFIGGGKSPVDPVTYITTILTGSPTGSVNTGEYDKKRFKFGTPFAQYQTDPTIGYYYSTDAKGQEIPLIAPATGTANSIPTYLQQNPGVYNPPSEVGFTDPYPAGAKNWLIYGNPNSWPLGTRGMVFTPIKGSQYVEPSNKTYFDPLLGIVGPSGTSSSGANSAFISRCLAFIDNLKYKSFSPISGDTEPAKNPMTWALRGR